MKTLSLKQPYAELILQGRKTIELRKWNTKVRGNFLIHASGNIDETAMKKFGFDENALPRKAIVGQANLVDVKEYENKEQFEEDKDKHLADDSFGNFGFILMKPVRFEKPIPSKGNLGFWEFDLLSKLYKL